MNHQKLIIASTLCLGSFFSNVAISVEMSPFGMMQLPPDIARQMPKLARQSPNAARVPLVFVPGGNKMRNMIPNGNTMPNMDNWGPFGNNRGRNGRPGPRNYGNYGNYGHPYGSPYRNPYQNSNNYRGYYPSPQYQAPGNYQNNPAYQQPIKNNPGNPTQKQPQQNSPYHYGTSNTTQQDGSKNSSGAEKILFKEPNGITTPATK